MSKRNYTILDKGSTHQGLLLRALVDNKAGFSELLSDHHGGKQLSPGSTVDVADAKSVARLRNDGTWEIIKYYGDAEAPKAEEVLYNTYGVSWDLGSAGTMTRTGAAANFLAPTPSVNGSAGSSPFDGLYPWSGMQVVEDELAGSFVAIPKYWYRIEHTGEALNISIADGPVAGYSVSPAHMDRGDGKGERDVVYIARYKIVKGDGSAPFGSFGGKVPVTNFTRALLRTQMRQLLGDRANVYTTQDYAMFWTVRLLMLVEYAVWDLQTAIGYGCGNGESVEATGSTDTMPYHTGTVGATRDTYCVGVQYRYIEDMWANVAEFIDGWRLEIDETAGVVHVYVTMNPSEYSDEAGGVKVGEITSEIVSGIIKDWFVPAVEGYSWALTPSAVASEEEAPTYTEYVADGCELEGPALLSGGSAVAPFPDCGPFFLGGGPASYADPFVGARLQKIP